MNWKLIQNKSRKLFSFFHFIRTLHSTKKARTNKNAHHKIVDQRCFLHKKSFDIINKFGSILPSLYRSLLSTCLLYLHIYLFDATFWIFYVGKSIEFVIRHTWWIFQHELTWLGKKVTQTRPRLIGWQFVNIWKWIKWFVNQRHSVFL